MEGLKRLFVLMTLLAIVSVLYISSTARRQRIDPFRLPTPSSDPSSTSWWWTKSQMLHASLTQEDAENEYTDDNSDDNSHATEYLKSKESKHRTEASHGYTNGGKDNDSAKDLKSNGLKQVTGFHGHPDDIKDDVDPFTCKCSKLATPNRYGMVQKRLIILTYMRSGSSMTGRLFDGHPDVFYWFEPLHSLSHQFQYDENVDDKWAKWHQLRTSPEATGNISRHLSCDIKNVFRQSLKEHFMDLGQVTKPFKNCFKNAARDLWLTKSSAMWDRCVTNLTKVCLKNYQVVVVKTIRFSLSRAVELMREDPSLMVLHLVRDPRGVLESRRRLMYANFSNLQWEARNLCKGISDDVDISYGIQEGMKKQYKLIRYEDIAMSLVQAAKLFYEFVGLKPSMRGFQLAEKMSINAPGSRKACATCPAQRSDSRTRSQAWRQSMTLREADVISKYCSRLMTRLGYRLHFGSGSEMRNVSVSAVMQPGLKIASSGFQKFG